MFGFLKDKLKSIMSSLSKKVEKEAEPIEDEKQEIKKSEVLEQDIKEKNKLGVGDITPKTISKETKTTREKPKVEAVKKDLKKFDIPKIEELAVKKEVKKAAEEDIKGEIKEILGEKKGEVEERKSFFQKVKESIGKKAELITTVSLSEDKFNNIFWDLEMMLLENNVAVEVIEKIKHDLKGALVDKRLKRSKIENKIKETLKDTISNLFLTQTFDLIEKVKSKKPFVISFVGVNGSGKTTSIAKVANHLKNKGLKVVLAASDTFRAAAIDQIQQHADKLNIKLIKHDYGSDAAAVSFDAIQYAKAHFSDVVLIDTAGRLHSNVNLMDELKKIKRVANPDLTIFVGEAITGNDCVEQAKEFNSAVNIDAIILSKADVDEKGGAAISVSYVTKKPILYLGTGQGYNDLQKFTPEIVLKNLGLD